MTGLEDMASEQPGARRSMEHDRIMYLTYLLLSQTADSMVRLRETRLGRFGLTSAQASALIFIWRSEGRATGAEVARWLFRQPHSVVSLLDRLERDGYIRKTRDPDRRNIKRLDLTETGVEALEHALDISYMCEVLNRLSEQDRVELRRLLTGIRAGALDLMGIDAESYPNVFDAVNGGLEQEQREEARPS